MNNMMRSFIFVAALLFAFAVRATEWLYCVIDLSAGSCAACYPVSYLSNVPDGGWTDEYKTNKLVLRRIATGSFIMGEDQANESHRVTIKTPFLIGVFEMTQRQWELVMGSRPSYFSNDSYYAARPVEYVSSYMIQSCVKYIQSRTGLAFDLPTEEQWEYACRAGATTDYNNGTDYSEASPSASMNIVGRNLYNCGSSWSRSSDSTRGTAKVGSYVPNAWGLYDMHGNVWEWCLDEQGSLANGRGGSWHHYPEKCTSFSRSSYDTSYLYYNNGGFRLSRTLTDEVEKIVISFDANGGCCDIASTNVVKNTAVGILPTPARNGYAFLGWYTEAVGGNQVLTETVLSENVSIYAHWRFADGGPYTEIADGIEWKFVVKDGEVTLGGNEESRLAVPASTAGEITVPAILGGCPVTVVGESAFFECSEITSVTLPDGVCFINGSAFGWCEKLTHVMIPESVTNIGESAFCFCRALLELPIPSGTTRIMPGTFYGCDSIEDAVIPASVTSVGEWAFGECNGLVSVSIHSGVTNIEQGAFSHCRRIVSFDVAEGNLNYKSVNGMLLTKDGTLLIQGVNGNVAVPNSVLHIDDNAFSDYHNLKTVSIPASTLNIAASAFNGCVPLSAFQVDVNNSAFKSENGLVLSKDGSVLFHGVNGDVAIPSGVTEIADGAFHGRGELLSIRMPFSLADIGDYAFYECSNLVVVTLSQNVTNIGKFAFYGCTSLTSVAMPDAVSSIEPCAFDCCSALTNVVFSGNAPTCGFYAFNGVESCCTALVYANTTGWGDSDTWQGLKLIYRERAYPLIDADATAEEIALALAGSADKKLSDCITNVANYNAYRMWSESIGAQDVKESSNAWFSFAVGSDKLISEMPTSEDIKVDEFVPSSESGKFDFTVSIDGVTVGEEALKGNLKQVFGIEGGTSLEPGGLSSANVNITFGTPENGKVKFTAGPKNAKEGSFFMRVKMTP